MNKITTILAPIDFSENAHKIADAALYIAGTFKARLSYVFVVQDFEDYSGFMVPPVSMVSLKEDIFASAQKQMNEFVEQRSDKARQTGIPTIRGTILTGDVAEEILEHAKSINCNLIVMGTHGYKGVERILFGSIADKVVKNACCPVMTINPFQEECEGR